MPNIHPARPNILFLLSDDQGPWALGCAGNAEIQTPYLDGLASRGMRFANFFCTSPVCSPARASLLTGRIPSQHGVHDWLREGNHVTPREYLADQSGYTEILAQHGYRVGLSGKWHLGESAMPQKGHAHWYVHERGGGPYYQAPMFREGQLIHEPGYVTEAITDDALAFIDRCAADDQPFYAGVHYTAPHSPWVDNHPQEYVDLYTECPFESCPQEPKHPWVKPTILAEAWADPRPNLMGYFAAVTAMDAQIGRLLARLDELGLREDTLVFFTSDNGFNCGHHGIWGKGNGTYPLNMVDSSIKVPALVSQPGHIPESVVREELISGYDFMPTLLDYLHLPLPSGVALPGRSMAALWRGEPLEAEREPVVVFDEYGPVRMIRSHDWKYVHRHPDGPHELYDLQRDPDERHNLVADADHHRITAEMKEQLAAWFARYVDPALDGVNAPVSGLGQVRTMAEFNAGENAFAAFS